MDIQIKNVKHAEWASEETHCFSASVYIDGKRAGTVRNEGSGGSNMYDPYSLEEQLDEYAKTLPSGIYKFDGKAHEFKENADTIIGELVNNFLYERDLKRIMTTHIVWCDQDGKLRQSKKYSQQQIAGFLQRADILAKLNAVLILNTAPLDRAVKAFRDFQNGREVMA